MNTEFSHIQSLIEPPAKKILHEHNVTPEQYLAWLMRASAPMQISPWVVVFVSLAGGAIMVLTLGASGVIPWDGKLLALGLGTSVCLAIIFGLSVWTMGYAKNPIGEKMLMLHGLRKLSPEYLNTLNANAWKSITFQQQDLEKKSHPRMRTDDHRLQLWHKRLFWLTLILALSYFVVSEAYQFLALPLFFVSLGALFTVKGARILFGQTFLERTSRLVVTGTPAKVRGMITIIFGGLIALLGLIATIQWFLGSIGTYPT